MKSSNCLKCLFLSSALLLSVFVSGTCVFAEEAGPEEYVEPAGGDVITDTFTDAGEMEVGSVEEAGVEAVGAEETSVEAPGVEAPGVEETAAQEETDSVPAAEEPAPAVDDETAVQDVAADTVPEGESEQTPEDYYYTEEYFEVPEETYTETQVWETEPDYTYDTTVWDAPVWEAPSTYDAFEGTAQILQEEEENLRDQAFYDEFVDLILSVIIKDDMTDEEKCQAVYDYVHEIPYVNVVYSQNWKENGYRMLHDRAGDCFGFYSASRLLLERLGYQVLEMQNVNGFTHVWCLVSIDDGQTWRHFDPTCWSWGSDGYLCLLTDEELTEYGMKHQVGYNMLSHDWDEQQMAEAIMAYENQKADRVYLLYQEDNSAKSSVVSRRSLIESEPQQ